MSEARMILNEQLFQLVVENVRLLTAEDEYIHSDDYYSEISRMLDAKENE